jgi:TPR repeat protein
MKKLIATVILLIALLSPTWAGFDEGLKAFNSGDYETALREWRPLAEQGEAKAQVGLGALYYYGQGVPQDYAEAARWYHKAAEQGHAWAQGKTGSNYLFGEGVTQDYDEAASWFRKGAEQGDAKAQYNLGMMYYSGRSVTQDDVQAYKWIDLAISRLPPGKEHEMAVNNRDRVARQMTPEEISKAQELARNWRPKQ